MCANTPVRTGWLRVFHVPPTAAHDITMGTFTTNKPPLHVYGNRYRAQYLSVCHRVADDNCRRQCPIGDIRKPPLYVLRTVIDSDDNA